MYETDQLRYITRRRQEIPAPYQPSKDDLYIEVRNHRENPEQKNRSAPLIPAWLEEVGPSFVEKEAHNLRRLFPRNLLYEVNQVTYSLPRNETRHTAHNRETLRVAGAGPWQEQGVQFSTFAYNEGCIPEHAALKLTKAGAVKQSATPWLKCSQDKCNLPIWWERASNHPYEWWPTRWCWRHFKFHRAGVTLGKVYNSGLPPELTKHVTSILSDPDGMAAREELAMAKALGALMLRKFSEAEGGMDAKMAATAINVMDKIATIADKQAKISDKQDSKLSYKQVLVLISAAVERTLQVVGKSEDARTMLYTILPDLPWPSGVARVHGSEGLIGAKGQLILPAKPSEKKLIIDADFEGLDQKYEPDGKVITEEQRKELQGFLAEPSVFDRALRRACKIQKDACPPDGFMLYEDPVAPPGVPPEDFDSTGFKVSQLDIL